MENGHDRTSAALARYYWIMARHSGLRYPKPWFSTDTSGVLTLRDDLGELARFKTTPNGRLRLVWLADDALDRAVSTEGEKPAMETEQPREPEPLPPILTETELAARWRIKVAKVRDIRANGVAVRTGPEGYGTRMVYLRAINLDDPRKAVEVGGRVRRRYCRFRLADVERFELEASGEWLSNDVREKLIRDQERAEAAGRKAHGRVPGWDGIKRG